MKDPPSDTESDAEQAETISAVTTTGKGSKRKGLKNDVKSKSANNDDDANQPSNVIYLGHLPVGFEDREITVFLNQFGNVHRCRVSRSMKTGRPRGYAFVEFADAEVAKIVAETMSGYFLQEKRLVCHVLPMDKVYEGMFAKSKRVITKKDRQKVARTECNKRRSAEAMKEITAKLVKREGMKRKRLEELGIEYDFPGYTTAATAQSVAVSDGNSQTKKSKVADGNNDGGGGNKHEVDISKSQKKKKVTKSSGVVETGEKQPEDNVTNDIVKAVDSETTSATKNKRKQQTKTPKKTKPPKHS